MKKARKILSLVLICTLLSTIFVMQPYADGEDYTVTFYPTDDVYVRGSEVIERGNLVVGCMPDGSNPSAAFLKFDLTGYKNLINIAKSVTFSAVSAAYADAAVKVTVLPENKNDWSSSTLTYSTASDGGYLTAGTQAATINAPLDGDIRTETTDFLASVKALTGDTLSLRLDTDYQGYINLYGGTDETQANRPALTLTIDAEHADDIPAVQAAYDELDLGDLSAVTNDLVLPSAGAQGTYIKWATSKNSVVSATGKIYPYVLSTDNTLKDAESASATLTATLQRGAVTMTKTFDVTVPSLAQIFPAADGFTRKNSNAASGKESQFYVSDGTQKDVRYGLLNFDFSANKDLIANAEKVELVFAPWKNVSSYMTLQIHNITDSAAKTFTDDSLKADHPSREYVADASNITSFAAGEIVNQKTTRVDVTLYAKNQADIDGIAAFKFVGGGLASSGNGTYMYFLTNEGAQSHTRWLIPRLVVTLGEEKTVTVNAAADTYIDSSAQTASNGTASSVVVANKTDAQKSALLKFDLTGYEDQLATATGISLKMPKNQAPSSITSARVYGLPEALNGWDENTTYQSAQAITDGTNNLATYTATEIGSFLADPDAADNSCYLDLDYFKSLTGKTAALKIDANAVGDEFSYNSKESGNGPVLVITYHEKSDLAKLYDNLKYLDLGDLSNVTSNLDLPKVGKNGETITWTSSKPLVISNEGIVHPTFATDVDEIYPEGTSVVLTAQFEKNGVKATRDFTATVGVMGYTTASDDTFVRERIGAVYGHETIVHNIPNDRYSFFRFDIGNQVNYYKNAKKVFLRLYKNHQGGLPTCNLKITAIDDDNLVGSWDEDTLTIHQASDLVAYTGTETWTYENSTQSDFVFTVDVTDYLRGNDRGLVEFKIESLEGNNALFTKEAGAEYAPALIAYWDDSASDFIVTANDMYAMFELPEGDVEIVTAVDNTSGAYSDGFNVIYAIYADGVLKSTEIQTVESVPQQSNALIPSKILTITESQNETIKVFIWSRDLNVIKPITKQTCFPN